MYSLNNIKPELTAEQQLKKLRDTNNKNGKKFYENNKERLTEKRKAKEQADKISGKNYYAENKERLKNKRIANKIKKASNDEFKPINDELKSPNN